MSTVTTATFTQVLDEARAELREGGNPFKHEKVSTDGAGVSFDGP